MRSHGRRWRSGAAVSKGCHIEGRVAMSQCSKADCIEFVGLAGEAMIRSSSERHLNTFIFPFIRVIDVRTWLVEDGVAKKITFQKKNFKLRCPWDSNPRLLPDQESIT